MGSSVEIRQLSKIFLDKRPKKRTEALLDINLEIKANELVCLVGPSGCGKTTFLRVIAGLEKPSRGAVYINGHEVKGPGPERGLVPQEFALFPWRTVFLNVSFGPEILGLPLSKRKEITEHCIKLVRMEGCENKYPGELSGGMKQRVAIARALANNPEVLLMDEPFGSLDAQTRSSMQEELLGIWNETRNTIVFVTHSVDEAVYLSNRVIVMSPRPGRIETILDIAIKHPRDRTGKDFIAYRKEILGYIMKESWSSASSGV